MIKDQNPVNFPSIQNGLALVPELVFHPFYLCSEVEEPADVWGLAPAGGATSFWPQQRLGEAPGCFQTFSALLGICVQGTTWRSDGDHNSQWNKAREASPGEPAATKVSELQGVGRHPACDSVGLMSGLGAGYSGKEKSFVICSGEDSHCLRIKQQDMFNV